MPVSIDIIHLQNVTLALEQMLIMLFNPKYNKIKIVGGTVTGLKHKAESLLPANTKNSIITSFYQFLINNLFILRKVELS